MNKLLGLIALTLTLGLTALTVTLVGRMASSELQGANDELSISITDEGFGEMNFEDDEYFGEMHSYGVYANTLFGKMNELNPNLKIDESSFKETYYEVEGESYFDGYVSSVSDGVMIYYNVLADDEWTDLKDKSSAGMVDGVILSYNKNNPSAVAYALEFLETFNRIIIENHLMDEAHELSEGLKDYYLNITKNEYYENEELDEDLDSETIKMLEMIGAESLTDAVTIYFQ